MKLTERVMRQKQLTANDAGKKKRCIKGAQCMDNEYSRKDLAKKKRVELHLHTRYSEMDAATNIGKLIDRVAEWGHKAVAITDHGVVQGFLDVFHKAQYMENAPKIIYGMEGYLVDDSDLPVFRNPESREEIKLLRDCAGVDPYEAEAIRRVKLKPCHHISILIKNETGRKNLYRLVSLAHINYFDEVPRIPKSVLSRYRDGLLFGSACAKGEIYDALLSGESEERIRELMDFYDYLEIQPAKYCCQSAFVATVRDINRKIYELGKKSGKLVVATGDVHFLEPEDATCRQIILESQGKTQAVASDQMYMRTTEEMLVEFAYLGLEAAQEVVVENTNAIADMIEHIEPVRPDKCFPVIENAEGDLRRICYERARKFYGPVLPHIVAERLEKELDAIISNGYAFLFMTARELVQKSIRDGYQVGSRGCVGASLVALLSGITEINPLKPHYRCENCHYSDFDSEDVRTYAGGTGCDMPDKKCPVCGMPMVKDGFDIPVETFLGFRGDKEPDIDLNFAGEYQSCAQDYMEIIFGKEHTFRAGTISTLQYWPASFYVRDYCERHGLKLQECEIDRLIDGCKGVKCSTGQHPGGIMVLPQGEEIYSFTPIQHPANDASSRTVTTHFEYHSIDHNLLKQDILGHDSPTMLHMLEEMTGHNSHLIHLADPDVMKLFEGTEVLGIAPEDIEHPLGTLGIPEFGTDFVMQMLLKTKPKLFSDLIRIAGLCHGTDVWLGNAEELIKEGTTTLSECICNRDDIMNDLVRRGMEPSMAFDIMENVRKGKVARGFVKKWHDWEIKMKECGVPNWYIQSCTKIQYMFPKAHSVAYTLLAFRIAYYKIFYPAEFYAAYFTIKAEVFDHEKICQGKEHLRKEIKILKERIDRQERNPGEEALLRHMYVALEMYARGFEFAPLPDPSRFMIDGRKLMPSVKAMIGKVR